jgi:uncharacterized protein (TIGR00369 family)
MNLRRHLDQWLAGATAPPPIVQKLGIRLVSFSDGQAVTEMPVARELWNAMGTLHGGIFADLADVTMGVALATSAQDGETFASVNLTVTFFASVREGLIRASASVVRRGRTSGYAECTIENEAGVLIAKASSLCSFQKSA